MHPARLPLLVQFRIVSGKPARLHARDVADVPPSPRHIVTAPRRVVRATAPVRTADVGGWTDTWFAGRGTVTNVAVGPGVGVTVSESDLDDGFARVVIEALRVDTVVDLRNPLASSDPFVAMAIAHGSPSRPVDVRLKSFVPAACGLGTSAAVSVAVIGALWAFAGRQIDPVELAVAAHGVETALGLQSGVQDQLAAALGGTRRYDIRYPKLRSSYVLHEDPVRLFDGRLLTVYLGQPHSSSDVHNDVIAELEAGGHRNALDDLRVAAMNAAAALSRSDLAGFGRCLRAHNEATQRLHEPIVSPLAEQIGALSDIYGGLGWKANGAGGRGGTLSLVTGHDPEQRAELIAAINAHPNCAVLDLRPTGVGLTVQEPSVS